MSSYLIDDLLRIATETGASDLHITVGLPPMVRRHGSITPIGEEVLTPETAKELVLSLMSSEQHEDMIKKGENDFSYAIPDFCRYRVNTFFQKQCYGTVCRVIRPNVPSLEDLKLPACLSQLALRPRGLLLVTGPTGSGKSTTLAAMVSYINANKKDHILTIEDPIEYIHNHNKSMVNQREVGQDTHSFANALRAALREDPDVILLGEMRDLETISTAVTAAETGHFVMATLHTTSAAQTVDRVIDAFPPHQQQQIRVQLSAVLQGVICQQLVPRAEGGGRYAATEILIANDAVRNMIREGKTHQINNVIMTNLKVGMMSMDYSLAQLVKEKKILLDHAMERAVDPVMLQKYLESPMI